MKRWILKNRKKIFWYSTTFETYRFENPKLLHDFWSAPDSSHSVLVHCSSKYSHCTAAQRAKFSKKVHKPPHGFNVINVELNWFNAFIWVPWNPSDPKKTWCTDKSIQISRNKLYFCTYSSISVKSQHRLIWLFWCRLKLWVPKWNADDMYKIWNLDKIPSNFFVFCMKVAFHFTDR